MSVIAGISSNLNALRDQNSKIPKFRERAITQADQYEVPAKAMDELALDSLDTMNTAKQSLITIGGKNDRDVACYAVNAADTTTYFNTHYGSIATGIGTTTGAFTNISGIGADDWVGFASITTDTLTAFQYPKVETGTLNVADDDPRAGSGTVTINSGNAGIGVTTIHTVNGGSTSRIFALTNACHAGVDADIDAAVASYNSASTGISTFIDAANLVKNEKTELRFIAWSLGRQIGINSVGITTFESVLDALEDPGLGGPY